MAQLRSQTFDLQALLKQLEEQQAAVNQSGLERYQNLLSSVAGTKESVMGSFGQAQGLAAGMGTTGQAQIAADRTRQMGASEQGLVSRGLGNTTIRAAARRGINSDAERASQDLRERVTGQQAGLLTQQAGAQADMGRLESSAILSRQDIGPPMDLYASLIQSLAARGGLQAGAKPKTHNFIGAAPPRTPQFASGPSISSPAQGVQTFTSQSQPQLPQYSAGGISTYRR